MSEGSNVRQLGEQQRSDEACIQALDEAARRARAGGVTGVVVILQYGRRYESKMCLSTGANRQEMLGEIELVKHDLMQEILNGREA